MLALEFLESKMNYPFVIPGKDRKLSPKEVL